MIKQHVHNWQIRRYSKRTLGWQWGRPDFWGVEMFLYMACIRGGKIKHTMPRLRTPEGKKFAGQFITASGIIPEGWVDEEFARDTGREQYTNQAQL
jgi:hypothetical protein